MVTAAETSGQLVGRGGAGRRRGRSIVTAAAAAAGLLALALSGVLPAPPSGRVVVENAASALGDWALPFMATAAFLETTIPPVSLFFPGEWALLFGGAMAADGVMPIGALLLTVWVCSTAGDSVAFLIGRRFGRSFLLRYGRPFGVTAPRLARVDAWFERYGPAAIAIGRLVNFVRPTAPILAGATRFSYRRFLPWSMLGTLAFSLVYCLLGFAFYRSYDELVTAVGRGSAVVLAVVVAVAVVLVRRSRRAATDPPPAARS